MAGIGHFEKGWDDGMAKMARRGHGENGD